MNKQIIFIAFAVFLTQSCFSQATVKLEKLLSAYAQQYKFNGAVLVAHKGQVLVNKGYGLRNADANIPNDRNSIFQIGSVTKQFTATIILKLQEEKKLSVNDKLSKYFPGYAKGDSITLEHLLTHTSGIYSYTSDPDFMANEVSKPADRQKMMALFKEKPLQFSPGTQWEYSNSAYMLLGYIIEDVTGLPYERVVRRYIFEPLSMSNSGLDFTHLSNNNKTTGYFRLLADKNTPAPIVDSSVSYSAGAIYSTVGDLYKWHESLQADRVISKASKARAYTPIKNKYGYGWVVDSVAGRRKVGHSGGIHGFNSNMAIIPEDTTCVILLANAANPNLDKITQSIFAVLYDLPYEVPKEKTAIDLPVEVLKQYTGVYELSPQLIITISVEDGKLIGKPEGQEARQLHPEKKDQFFLKEIDAQVNFTRNEKSEITSMSLLQNGRETSGKKR
jgi:CubicO group peptidase (beta-lactamase class C family)